MGLLQSFYEQHFNLPEPQVTEKNMPDQTGRVHLVTGGYSGVGEHLARILYGANASVFIAGRSADKAQTSIRNFQAAHPDSKGSVKFLHVDLSDLRSIAPAADEFRRESFGRLDVLYNNAGVMTPPAGSQSVQGYELQMATNCMGPFLLTKFLMPLLEATAADSGKGTVRVLWAGSMAIDLGAPKGGFAPDIPNGKGLAGPKVLGRHADYGQSKSGNLLLAAACANREGLGNDRGILHYCFNPGALKTGLQRNQNLVEYAISWLLSWPAHLGAYTELYAALSPDLGQQTTSGSYIAPWGRLYPVRTDLSETMDEARYGKGMAHQFLDWCEQETEAYTKIQ